MELSNLRRLSRAGEQPVAFGFDPAPDFFFDLLARFQRNRRLGSPRTVMCRSGRRHVIPPTEKNSPADKAWAFARHVISATLFG
jgi:hypothetical protein